MVENYQVLLYRVLKEDLYPTYKKVLDKISQIFVIQQKFLHSFMTQQRRLSVQLPFYSSRDYYSPAFVAHFHVGKQGVLNLQ